ncbi:MAG: hypothetical protein GX601_04550 [Anaerolineales bacterium]|nr:hypothetical protein [Anaerolineales bacterium]
MNESAQLPVSTDWFADCGWGVFCHYLAPLLVDGEPLSAEQWNAQVDSFQVERLADQLSSIGAPYLILTIGQNSGHFIAPNATYDRYVGRSPSRCASRDLVADVAEVLAPHGIRLLVYLPSGAPAADELAVDRLGWRWGFEASWPDGWNRRRTGQRLAAFQERWEDIVREWSLRWGTRVAGWWIDGCYFADEMYHHPDAPNFASFADALKAGNPASIVAFNPGVLVPVVCHSVHEDYTAGEISDAFPVCPGPWVEREGHRARYHILSYLGERWGGGVPRFPDEFAVGYTQHVAARGGVVSWDVPIGQDGALAGEFLGQLTAIGTTMARWRASRAEGSNS